MGKHTITKRRYSHQPKVEPTFVLFEHLNTSIRLKHRNTFRPLATSTPYDIEQIHSFYIDSPRNQQRPLLTPPVFCSTPKQTRRQSSTVKRKIPVVISQRRLQFTPNSQSFVRYTNDDTKRMNVQNIKIWLL